MSSSTLAAIKVSRSESPYTARELHTHEALLQAGLDRSIKDHIVTIMDHFKQSGPNGEHLCLVFEPMGPDMNSLFIERPDSSRWMPYEHSRQAVLQVLQGLHCLYRRQIAYCDMNFGNLLTTVNLDELTKEMALPTSNKVVVAVKSDDEQRQSRPKQLYEDRPLSEFADHSVDVKIKLSDLGAGKSTFLSSGTIC
jgi:serine/threonine protein kinase